MNDNPKNCKFSLWNRVLGAGGINSFILEEVEIKSVIL